MYAISSLSSKLVKDVLPFANAASNKARLEMLFDPGILIVPLIREIGCKVKRLHIAIESLKNKKPSIIIDLMASIVNLNKKHHP
ncbi:hypothetical protein [Pantoea sp. Aalb]|uniref:hypothetical protein n=1 Tax=Pantoea sp. Aalb TaxID=2576762 RepID=UPI001F2726C2|nr:hypothetical protein [Pantoea sp. Aalb]